jgi:hypothetical protein
LLVAIVAREAGAVVYLSLPAWNYVDGEILVTYAGWMGRLRRSRRARAVLQRRFYVRFSEWSLIKFGIRGRMIDLMRTDDIVISLTQEQIGG